MRRRRSSAAIKKPRALLQGMQSETRALFERMDARAERMDQRADERHREVMQTIQTLRA